MGQCEMPECQEPATHRSGWGNDRSANCCVPHTREREECGAWSRSIAVLVGAR